MPPPEALPSILLGLGILVGAFAVLTLAVCACSWPAVRASAGPSRCPCWEHDRDGRPMFLMALGLAGGVGLVLGAVIGNPALGMFTLGIITYLGLHRRAWHCNRRSCTERGYCRHV